MLSKRSSSIRPEDRFVSYSVVKATIQSPVSVCQSVQFDHHLHHLILQLPVLPPTSTKFWHKLIPFAVFWEIFMTPHSKIKSNTKEQTLCSGFYTVNYRKQKLFSIIVFFKDLISSSFRQQRSRDNASVNLVTMVMGPMGLMKSSIKQKLFAIIGLFLRIYVG